MQCPHCRKAIYFEEITSHAYRYDEPQEDGPTGYDISHGFCPACESLIVLFRNGRYFEDPTQGAWLIEPEVDQVLYPTDRAERTLGPEVPESYKRDYDEAVAVLPHSAKASAAITRRLLQHILREDFAIKPSDLAKEIETFIDLSEVPSYIAEAVDAVRNVGNLAAHPLKNKSTGQVVDVEHGEAEWLLDVIESLCDFRFVQPARIARRRQELNAKLEALGKPPMKGRLAAPGK
jgi:hypothetical protein